MKYRCTTILLILVLLMSLAFTGCAQDGSDPADLIVYGKIYTSDAGGSFAEALAVKGGKYVYVGDAEGAKAYLGPDTETVEAEFAMPSAVESHAHCILEEAFKLGLYLERYNPDGSVKTPGDLVQDIAAYRNKDPELSGIYGYGWDMYIMYAMGIDMNRAMLDECFEDIPVYISERSLHAGWCNTKCLELAGALNEEIPAAGVERDEQGVATGLVKDEACTYIRNAVFGPLEGYATAVENAQALLHSKGYTMLLDPWSNFDGTTAMSDAVLSADRDGRLKTVVLTSYCVNSFDDTDAGIKNAAASHKAHTSAHTEQKFVKLFADGTETTRTAYVLEPYGDGGHGVANWEDTRMDEVTAKANAAGLLVHIHAYGDASARQAVNAYEYSNTANGKRFRNSIAHAPYVADTDLARIRDLEIGVCGSGNWAVGSASPEYDEIMIQILGEDRLREYYMVDKFAQYGIKAGVSTDRPCADGFAEDVFDYIGVLTTGIDYREGYEAPAKRDKWVSVEEAIRMLTINGAWSLDADQERGSIEVGKYADFILASGNPFETELNEIHQIKVVETYFEGEKVFSAENDYGKITKAGDKLYEVTFDSYEAYQPAVAEKLNSMYKGEAPGCTSIYKNGMLMRNLDWYIKDGGVDVCELVVHTTANEGRYATVGVAFNPLVTDETFDSIPEEKKIILPFTLTDGMNSEGLMYAQNVCPEIDGISNTYGINPDGEDLCYYMAGRQLLDHCANVDEAIEYLRNSNLYMNDLGTGYRMESHMLLADKNRAVIVEFVDNSLVVLEQKDLPYEETFMTNHYLFNGGENTGHGMGYERDSIVRAGYASVTDWKTGMELLKSVRYTLSYTLPLGEGFWYSEYYVRGNLAGTDFDFDCATPKDDPDFLKYIAHCQEQFGNNAEDCWHTNHSSVYNTADRSLHLAVREDYDTVCEFLLEKR